MRKKHRVPGTKSPRSFVIPVCSVHGTLCQKNDDDEWFCFTCFEAWAREYVRNKGGSKTHSGIHLPQGVIDPAKQNVDVRAVLPNRAQRRANQKIRRRYARAG